jgi:uncharacterized membrane protein YedE/YeeE
MHNFTPLPALAGGALIGLSAAALLLFNGRIAGITGIVGGLLRPTKGDVLWRLLFVAGLGTGGLLMTWLRPGSFDMSLPRSAASLGAAGLLVGFGTRLSNGCTSGHGVCGIGRLSPRSLAATVTFILTGMVTVWAIRTLGGGRP